IDQHKLWWRGIHVPYEIKPERNHDDNAIEQAVTYMCHMLKEQLDRRFVLGMTLCFDELTVVLCDRSGIMAMKTSINIHEEPEQFIRVIAGFSLMTAEQLGWDTTMKIYLPLSDKTIPSYMVGPDCEGINGETPYHIHWVIDVLVDNKIEQYVSAAVISAMRSAEICTRATVVYEVIKFEDRYNPTEVRAQF
ncbi:hypothetical protein H0H87_008542, partial [Tephrocybe sp. NHM501043]